MVFPIYSIINLERYRFSVISEQIFDNKFPNFYFLYCFDIINVFNSLKKKGFSSSHIIDSLTTKLNLPAFATRVLFPPEHNPRLRIEDDFSEEKKNLYKQSEIIQSLCKSPFR